MPEQDEALDDTPRPEVVHRCPSSGEGRTPCCNRTPFELSRRDRITLDNGLVTCSIRGGE